MPVSSTTRDYRLDTAKGFLIALVVVGHFLESAGGWANDALRLPLTAIYMFHMPAFVFLAGVTSKTTNMARRLGTFAVLLIIFQTLYFVVVRLLGADMGFSPLVPFWILWFLLAMIWWNAALPLVVRAPRTAVVVSVIVSLLCGVLPFAGYTLTISRALVFLPFFVVGAVYGKRILAAVGRVRASVKALGVVASASAMWFIYSSAVDKGWLYGSYNFADLHASTADGILVRLVLMALAILATLTLLSLVPAKDGRLARQGRASLAIFLLHGVPLIAATGLLVTAVGQFGTGAAVPAVALAILTLGLLSVPWFDRTLRRVSSGAVEIAARPFNKAPAGS